MSQPILIIMAAGMGSRFGGLKQIQPVGPNGEIIMDYSVHDAYRAGFRKVVFVIKEEHQDVFREMTGKIPSEMDVRFAFQNLRDLPEGAVCPESRVKPWGTGQAVLAAREHIDGPFAVVNADDYYGPQAFKLLYDFLSAPHPATMGEERDKTLAMVAFELANTVTEHGSVSRGVCEVTACGVLLGITERLEIIKKDDKLAYIENGREYELPAGTLVSMNCWGFPQDFLRDLNELFVKFLETEHPNPDKCEFLIPTAVDALVREEGYRVEVLRTTDKWYGITYKEDLPMVVDAMKEVRI
ncbi:MAG: NTP transferase domain-containing protein [Oscillospiraceae bacterium]|nr:NTP transferase domain-containing protein [Oscillospiraceae bacterium]